jgi:hypothetical protein
MKELDATTNALRKEQGWGPVVYIKPGSMAGGLAGIAFDTPPKDWRFIGSDNGLKFYWPIKGRKSTRAILEKLDALPWMGKGEFNQAIGGDTPWSNYGLAEGPDGCYLLHVSEKFDYNAPDLEEITVAAYNQLLAQAKAERPV